MRIIVTGTVGLDKQRYLQAALAYAQDAGHSAHLCHVGALMYAEAPDVAPGRILDLPLSRLHGLRRSVMKDILALAPDETNLIVNTHATFRWRHGLFPAFDFDQLARFQADLYVCLLDTVETVHARLIAEHDINHSLKDLLVWREEEILATELMMLGASGTRQTIGAAVPSRADAPRFYIMAVGRNHQTAEMFYRLLFEPWRPKAYISFPMTHVANETDIRRKIDNFRREIARYFTVFDPADMEEFDLYTAAAEASRQGLKVLEVDVLHAPVRFEVAEILQVAGDIHAQIYARDFMLIDQSDMIISYIPEMPSGKPGLSSGVERELQHAHEATREVYVIWKPKVKPSPFITETATRVFPNLDEAADFFKTRARKATPKPR